MRIILFVICFLLIGCITDSKNEDNNIMTNANGQFQWITTSAGEITFTVDTAVQSVGIVLSGGPPVFKSGDLNSNFKAGEQVLINQSIVLYQSPFCQGDFDSLITFDLVYETVTSSTSAEIRQLGNFGNVLIPTPNTAYDTPANIINVPDQNSEEWFLKIIGVSGTVSMLNVPADLHGQTFNVIIGLSIRTNSEMT